ncbi:MAG: Hsp70 family protein, partial [Pseudomonadales bacterium]|nr:Hsp70 family protein [Pseudomonadales bacterium]
MALLQISEPGQSPLPHQFKRAIGIDLGTTNSLVAAVANDGTAAGGIANVIKDAEGRAILPSVVNYGTSGVQHIGYQAQAIAADDPHNTLASFKRLMGRGLKDISDTSQFKIVTPSDASDKNDVIR